MSNLKLDIIYYNTQSDFEMEFNLSGCCRMRIFKDKVETARGLVNTLARDVARSKIILIVTDLTGELSGVPIISRAINLPLIALDKQEFGIQTAEEFSVPDTAVPLVTKSGVYGGCIIESGPQSIIIVSSTRALRHEIMKAYVHNYVFDIGQILAYEERISQNGDTTPPAFLQKKTNSAKIEKLCEKEITTDKAEEDLPVEDSDRENLSNVFSESTDDEVRYNEIESSFEEIKSPKRRKGAKTSNIVLLVIVVLLLLGFGVLAYFLIYLPLINGENIFATEANNIISDFFTTLF